MTNNDITAPIKMRIEAFLHQFENDCHECMRRNYCSSCRAPWAKSLLDELRAETKSEQKPRIDNSIASRCKRVVEQLMNSDVPISAAQIVLPDCPAYLKEFTLNHMIEKGIISREREGYFYKYFLVKNKDNTTIKG